MLHPLAEAAAEVMVDAEVDLGLPDVAQLARRQDPSGGLDHGPVAVVLADRELAVGAPRRLDQRLAVGARARQRLLDQHRHPGRQAALGHLAVGVRRHHDDGDVRFGSAQRLVEVHVARDAVEQRRRVLIDERHLLGRRLARECGEPGPPEPARTYLQDLHSLMPPRVRPPTM